MPFDLTGFYDVIGQDIQTDLSLEIKAKEIHAAQQPPLPVADLGQKAGQLLPMPIETEPVRPFMDVQIHHEH